MQNGGHKVNFYQNSVPCHIVQKVQILMLPTQYFVCLFVCLDFTARQHINGHIVPNAIIGFKYYVKLCK
jgi:hypothetical protein